MARAAWLRRWSGSSAWAFADALLRGFSAILFWNSAAIGVGVLLLFLLSPWAGASALLGGLVSTAVAVALRPHPALLRSGLFGCNGALVGLVSTWFVPAHPSLLLMVVPAAALSAWLTSFLTLTFAYRWKLPALTLPFLLTIWLVFLALRPLELTFPPSLFYGFPWVVALETWARSALPTEISLFFWSMSWIFFQENILLGAGAFLLLLWRSRTSAFFAFLGYAVGLAVTRSLGVANDPHIWGLQALAGFNAAFVAVCLGGFFVELTALAALYALLGSAAAASLTMALAPLLAPAGLPLLNAPFLATTLAMLALLGSKRLNLGRVGLRAIPLEKVSTPEAFLDLLSLSKKSDQLKLTLPFYGLWFVAQGTHGLFTHWGHGSYAWDFIVVDQQGKSCRGIGRKAVDYYAFGLPVVAPAAGTVVDMLDSLPDNIPPEVNKKKPWGNYIVIDHGNGLCSELSHLRQHGCAVQKGQWVAREQIIGYVGNSGLSMEPHLHCQLQRGPELGANTLPAKFWGYYHHNGGRQFFIQNGVPQQGELISNHVSPPGSLEKRR